MRRIVVNEEIKLLAEKYAKGLEIGKNLSTKPLNSLKDLKEAMKKNTTKIVFSAKQSNSKGNKKRIFSATELPQYAEYIQTIIDLYSSINKLLPWQYDGVIHRMELVLKPEYLNAAVKIAKADSFSFADLIVKAMDYKGVRENIFPDYMRNDTLGIKTCVYCNAQFAITAETEPALTPAMIKKRGKRRGRKPQPRPAILRANYELDHNLPKSSYPYLCTNFYNLIPCCSSCNKHKSKYPLDFTLYAKNGDDLEPLYFELPTDDLLKFQLRHVCGGLHVELRDRVGGTLAEEFNKRFAIDAIYKEHSEEIRELLWRHYIYSSSGIAALKDGFKDLFQDGFDINRFILGTYADAKDVFKRPLTIMKQDVMRQLMK